jgi:tetratricopeptide (TPR) repeat protein
LIRFISWTLIILAGAGVASLVALPIFAEEAAERADLPRPEVLPHEPQLPEQREKPVAPIEELSEASRLPRVDRAPTDEHSVASLNAYADGDSEEAFKEAVLSLDPTPLEDNELLRALTNPDTATNQEVEKPNGRPVVGSVNQALQPVIDRGAPQLAARMNNAAAMTILHAYEDAPANSLQLFHAAEELAFQAADLQPSYCPALLNLSLFGGSRKFLASGRLEPTGSDLGFWWENFYPAEGCDDPALLYYRTQQRVFDFVATGDMQEITQLTGRLMEDPRWSGLAHSARGDAYYWAGIYNSERTGAKRPFLARHYFESALWEYEAASRLQVDDPGMSHGKALVYLELREGDKDGSDRPSLARAVQEAEEAVTEVPGSPRLQQTLIEAYEASGDYAAAARRNREFMSHPQQPPSPPRSLLPYAATSHGSGSSRELRVAESGAGGGILIDDEVIRQSTRMLEATTYLPSLSGSEGLDVYLSDLQYFSLLRDDLLSHDQDAFEEDLSRAPDRVRQDEKALLLLGLDALYDQAPETRQPEPATQALIDDYLAMYDSVPLESVTPPGLPQLQDNDLFYREGGNLFREHRRFDDALEVYRYWRSELEATNAGDYRLAEVERLIGETLFLDERYRDALTAFDRALKHRHDWPPYMVRRAFMYEELRQFGAAEDEYLRTLEAMHEPTHWMNKTTLEVEGNSPVNYYYPDGYQASKHLGDVILWQAEAARLADEENTGLVQERYEESARSYRDALTFVMDPNGFHTVNSTAAANNLGIALIRMGRYQEAITILESLTKPQGTPPPSWYPLAPDAFLNVTLDATGHNHAFVPDEYNPNFHLNLGWAHELSGSPQEARERYIAAVAGSPTFYPAWNDLGVLAAKEGRLDEAKGYFAEASDAAGSVADPYPYAAHNLGVASLRSGSGGFLEGQGFLGRAVRQDSAFAEKEHAYVFDNEVYFLELSLADELPGDWEFAARAERSTLTVSIGAVALLLWVIIRRTALDKGRETLIGRIYDWGRVRLGRRVSPYLGRLGSLWMRYVMPRWTGVGRPWLTPLALLVTAPAIALAEGGSLLSEDSAKIAMLLSLLYVAFVSLLVHHAGHALAALGTGLRVREAPWFAGIAQAIVLAALSGPFVAPMPATGVEGEAEERRRHLVLLGGPLASVLLAVLLFALFLVYGVPLLRFGAVLNLGLAAASLLAVPPLEGAMVSGGYYTRWVFWAAILVTVMSALVAGTAYL